MDFYGETIGPQQFVRYIAMSVTEGCPLGGVPLYHMLILEPLEYGDQTLTVTKSVC